PDHALRRRSDPLQRRARIGSREGARRRPRRRRACAAGRAGAALALGARMGAHPEGRAHDRRPRGLGPRRSPARARGDLVPRPDHGDDPVKKRPQEDSTVTPDNNTDNRTDVLAATIAKLEKQFGVGTIMRLGDEAIQKIDAIPTGALSLDLATGIGGYPRGRVSEI